MKTFTKEMSRRLQAVATLQIGEGKLRRVESTLVATRPKRKVALILEMEDGSPIDIVMSGDAWRTIISEMFCQKHILESWNNPDEVRG